LVDEEDPEHISRKETWYTSATGQRVVPKAFQGILLKGVQTNELKEFRSPFCLLGTTQSEFGIRKLPILCYRGTLSDPQWTDRDEESFSALCDIRFDLREAAKTLTPQKKVSGKEGLYYSLAFDVVISFGSTEFSAQVAWKVNGVDTKSPAAIIYDED